MTPTVDDRRAARHAPDPAADPYRRPRAFLIGKVLVRKLAGGSVSGRIVETEAYPPGDAAGHAYRGETDRNRTLFLERGRAYIYVSYGTSYMMNVSSERPASVRVC